MFQLFGEEAKEKGKLQERRSQHCHHPCRSSASSRRRRGGGGGVGLRAAVLQELSRLCVVCVVCVPCHAGRMPASDCCCRSSAFCRFISKQMDGGGGGGRKRVGAARSFWLRACVPTSSSPQTFATAGWDFRMRDAARREMGILGGLGKRGGYHLRGPRGRPWIENWYGGYGCLGCLTGNKPWRKEDYGCRTPICRRGTTARRLGFPSEISVVLTGLPDEPMREEKGRHGGARNTSMCLDSCLVCGG